MTTTAPRATAPDLRSALLDAMTRLGVRSELGYYLDWVDDDMLPPWVPLSHEDAYRHEHWCWDCIQALCAQIDQLQATWEHWNGAFLAQDGEPYWSNHYGIGCDASGEGPYWCHACEVYLSCGFTEYSVDTVLDVCQGGPLVPRMLPEILEALEYVGESLPHACRPLCRAAPFHADWQAPVVVLDSTRWRETAFVRVEVPCCGCLAPVVLEARHAKTVLADVDRWQCLHQLARRAVAYFAQEVSS